MKIEGILNNVNHWFECKGVLHIGMTTGKPGHWVAHPLCGKKLRRWIGFGEIKYAKTDEICDLCFLLYVAKRVVTEAELIVLKGKA